MASSDRNTHNRTSSARIIGHHHPHWSFPFSGVGGPVNLLNQFDLKHLNSPGFHPAKFRRKSARFGGYDLLPLNEVGRPMGCSGGSSTKGINGDPGPKIRLPLRGKIG
jgi:hypothetical protein